MVHSQFDIVKSIFVAQDMDTFFNIYLSIMLGPDSTQVYVYNSFLFKKNFIKMFLDTDKPSLQTCFTFPEFGS